MFKMAPVPSFWRVRIFVTSYCALFSAAQVLAEPLLDFPQILNHAESSRSQSSRHNIVTKRQESTTPETGNNGQIQTQVLRARPIFDSLRWDDAMEDWGTYFEAAYTLSTAGYGSTWSPKPWLAVRSNHDKMLDRAAHSIGQRARQLAKEKHGDSWEEKANNELETIYDRLNKLVDAATGAKGTVWRFTKSDWLDETATKPSRGGDYFNRDGLPGTQYEIAPENIQWKTPNNALEQAWRHMVDAHRLSDDSIKSKGKSTGEAAQSYNSKLWEDIFTNNKDDILIEFGRRARAAHVLESSPKGKSVPEQKYVQDAFFNVLDGILEDSNIQSSSKAKVKEGHLKPQEFIQVVSDSIQKEPNFINSHPQWDGGEPSQRRLNRDTMNPAPKGLTAPPENHNREDTPPIEDPDPIDEDPDNPNNTAIWYDRPRPIFKSLNYPPIGEFWQIPSFNYVKLFDAVYERHAYGYYLHRGIRKRLDPWEAVGFNVDAVFFWIAQRVEATLTQKWGDSPHPIKQLEQRIIFYRLRELIMQHEHFKRSGWSWTEELFVEAGKPEFKSWIDYYKFLRDYQRPERNRLKPWGAKHKYFGPSLIPPGIKEDSKNKHYFNLMQIARERQTPGNEYTSVENEWIKILTENHENTLVAFGRLVYSDAYLHDGNPKKALTSVKDAHDIILEGLKQSYRSGPLAELLLEERKNNVLNAKELADLASKPGGFVSKAKHYPKWRKWLSEGARVLEDPLTRDMVPCGLTDPDIDKVTDEPADIKYYGKKIDQILGVCYQTTTTTSSTTSSTTSTTTSSSHTTTATNDPEEEEPPPADAPPHDPAPVGTPPGTPFFTPPQSPPLPLPETPPGPPVPLVDPILQFTNTLLDIGLHPPRVQFRLPDIGPLPEPLDWVQRARLSEPPHPWWPGFNIFSWFTPWKFFPSGPFNIISTADSLSHMMGGWQGMLGLAGAALTVTSLVAGLVCGLQEDHCGTHKDKKNHEEAKREALETLKKARDDPSYLVQQLHNHPNYKNYSEKVYNYSPHVVLGYDKWDSFSDSKDFTKLMKEIGDSDLALEIATSKFAMQHGLSILCHQEGQEVCDRLNKMTDYIAGRDTTDDPTYRFVSHMAAMRTIDMEINGEEKASKHGIEHMVATMSAMLGPSGKDDVWGKTHPEFRKTYNQFLKDLYDRRDLDEIFHLMEQVVDIVKEGEGGPAVHAIHNDDISKDLKNDNTTTTTTSMLLTSTSTKSMPSHMLPHPTSTSKLSPSTSVTTMTTPSTQPSSSIVSPSQTNTNSSGWTTTDWTTTWSTSTNSSTRSQETSRKSLTTSSTRTQLPSETTAPPSTSRTTSPSSTSSLSTATSRPWWWWPWPTGTTTSAKITTLTPTSHFPTLTLTNSTHGVFPTGLPSGQNSTTGTSGPTGWIPSGSNNMTRSFPTMTLSNPTQGVFPTGDGNGTTGGTGTSWSTGIPPSGYSNAAASSWKLSRSNTPVLISRTPIPTTVVVSKITTVKTRMTRVRGSTHKSRNS